LGATVKYLAEIAGGVVEGDGDIVINAAAPIETAGKNQISFLANNKYKTFLKTTSASAVVLSEGFECNCPAVIRHKNPYYAFAQILDELYPDTKEIESKIDSAAVVSDSAAIGDCCSVGALSFIGNNCKIADNCIIYPSVYLGNNVSLGKNCRLYPGVIINDDTKLSDNVIIHSGAVVGSDGFGYAQHEDGIKKVRQIGWVEIGNDTEIGANCTIDRGALGPTRIGRHVKIDNLVQIAHNVEIGDYSIIVSQAGISGSTKLGKGVILAGQVGLVGHIKLGDGVQVGAQSGVNKSIPPGKKVFGYPARDIIKTARIEACLNKLPDLFKRIRKLEENK